MERGKLVYIPYPELYVRVLGRQGYCRASKYIAAFGCNFSDLMSVLVDSGIWFGHWHCLLRITASWCLFAFV